MPLSLDETAEFLGNVLHHFAQCRQPSAPTSTPFNGIPNMLTQLLKGQADMAVDLSRLQADFAKALPLLQAVPGLKAQLADLQAKLTAVPHEDPSVQTAVDQMANDLEAAMPADVSQPVSDTPSQPTTTDPAPTEPTSTTLPADTTAEPAPVTTAPAETVTAPQTDTTPL